MGSRTVYPFGAIVGQDRMKLALILNTVNPAIGGVLIKGEKGTAKSTAVRALAALLPARDVVKGCACGCRWGDWNGLCNDCKARMEQGELPKETRPMEVVELPLNSTEDRVAGTLDIEEAITRGKKRFEPGILAKANGNILYVDEVNLLDDHIVDLLLDAAAMGTNYIEREGVSYTHPSKFILVGTMNPEEGELRPQLLDRFGLMVEVQGEDDEKKRIEIILRRMEFEKDPDAFAEKYREENLGVRNRIVEAQKRLPSVSISPKAMSLAVKTSIHLQIDGHRADLTMIKAACALAAWENRGEATPEDVVRVAPLVIPHRMRRNPFEDSSMDTGSLEDWMKETMVSL